MIIPENLLSLVMRYFENDLTRATLWFHVPNPVLKGMKPIDYKLGGTYDRLEKMIGDALRESKHDS